MIKGKKIQQELNSILATLNYATYALSFGDIEKNIDISMHKKTLQRRLKILVDDGLVETKGKGRNQKYVVYKDKKESSIRTKNIEKYIEHPIFSSKSVSLLSYLEIPSYARVKKSYKISLLENYIPNETQYVPKSIREDLLISGRRFDKTLAAGTYAKHIGQRLLIDLSYNSSRLEGNTYSILDTQKLIENGLTAEGKVNEETVMVMNHKEAILLLIHHAEDMPITSFTIRNIHYLLSQDLLKNPNSGGKVRQNEVSIGKSAYLPLNNPHQLEEYLALLLRKAEQIINPFEQSFFLLIHISYLQAFEDVNKRTARLACNIPFISSNLCPLSFIDVPQDDYFKALLYFYEKNDFLPALELFQWAYVKSCEQYDVVKESLGEIDSYRVQHRAERKEVMAIIIRGGITGRKIESTLITYCKEKNIDSADKFITMVIHELDTLHSGAIISLGITESVFEAWKSKR